MPIIQLQIGTGPINTSLQNGDVVYYSQTVSGQSGKNHHHSSPVNTKPKKLGVVTGINRQSLTISVNSPNPTPPGLPGAYLFFIKDGVANHSGIIGYFMETEYRNYSTRSSEMFATSVDFVESSR